MAEQELLNAFNDCIDRLSAGQGIDECLRRYPHFAADLRPMLETGQQVRAVRVSPVEVAQVQERARYRFEEAIRMTAPRRRASYPIYRFASLAAAVLLIGFVMLGGAGVAAQSSLPGEPLYGVKIFTEQIRLSFDPHLADQFDQRRVDETQQLLSAGRVADVTFRGEVHVTDATHWIVAGLPVQITAATNGTVGIHDSDIVEIRASTTTSAALIANTVIVLVEKPTEPTPLPTHVPTAFPVTVRPTATDTPTITPTPKPSLTSTATVTPTVTYTPSPTGTATLTPTVTMSATICIPTAPTGWLVYYVQPGDTLSRLASRHNITLDQLMATNCLVDPGFIVVGEELYLPPPPQVIPSQTPANGGDNINVNNDNGSPNGDGSGGSNGDDNNDNGDDHGGDHGNDNNGS